MLPILKNKIYNLSLIYGNKLGLDLPYFVKNGFWMTLRQIVDLLSGLAISIAFARLATKEVFGQYQFIIAAFSIAGILSLPGLNISILRSVSRRCDGDYKRAVRTSFRWSLLGVPLLLIFGAFYFFFGNGCWKNKHDYPKSWKPTTRIEKGIKHFVEWYREYYGVK